MLALDTSTSVGSVALVRDGEVLVESTLNVRATHSETVLPEIDRMMLEIGASPADLAAVVVGSGPGSFTGVRIAASLAKGICFARGAELFAYSSLAAVAAGTGAEGPICALFDARRGQVYAGGYRMSGVIEELFAPMAAPLEEVLELTSPGHEWTFVGDGADPGAEIIQGVGGRVLDRDVWYPRASSLARLARLSPEWGRVVDPRRWEPRYVRLPAAQRDLGD